jgi:hypothetical protein
MHELLDTLNIGWALVAGFVGVVAWFVRLESRVVSLEKDLEAESAARKQAHDDLKADSDKQVLTVWAKMDLMNASIVQILQATARLETAMKFKQRE